MTDLRVSFPEPCSEQWETMQPEGCNRFCQSCQQTIHDLSELGIEETETLLASGRKVCVRAKVDAGGVVELKSNTKATARRMVAIVGTSVGLLAMSGQAAATGKRPTGVIAGKITGGCGAYVAAIAADGREFVAKIKLNGRYKLKHLPDGSYKVVIPYGADSENWHAGSAVIQGGNKTVLDAVDPNECIVVGQMMIEDGRGEG